MTALHHTRVSASRIHSSLPRLLRLLFLGLVLVAATRASEARAGETSACRALDRAKWGSKALDDHYSALLLEFPEAPLAEVSMTSCWTCGIWKDTSAVYPGFPQKATEALLYQRAQCHRALGMQQEALEDCRTILRRYPAGGLVQEAIRSIVEILFQQGNYKAAVDSFDALDRDQRAGLLPASLYRIAQSCYNLGKDDCAAKLLKRVPPGTAVYPYALYTLAQVFYRDGDPDRALLIIRVVHDAPPEAHVPQMLREMARLTKARMLYQQKSYGKAIEEFRALRHSPYFLPEALMGIGWCYEAQGGFPKAIAYFQAVEASYADADLLVEAHLAMADVFAKANSYPDAFKTYRSILNDLHFRISQYKKYGGDPEWLDWLAARFLDRSGDNTSGSSQAQIMTHEADLPAEVEPLLERKKYASPRLKALIGIREALRQTGVLLDRVASPAPPKPTEGPVVPAVYPPLRVTVPSLSPPLPALLDLYFALLDTEYRLIHTGSLLGLLTPAEKTAFLRDALAFYRAQLATLLLPSETEQNARATLTRLQDTVRHLPFSLEEKERVLAKLVYTRRSLESTVEILEQWTEGFQDVSSSATQPTRFLLLEKWMTLARVYLSLHSWHTQSPAVFLLDHPSLAAYRPPSTLSSREELDRVERRIDTVWRRLALLAKREIANLHMERLDLLEGLLAQTQFDYADALIQEQGRILDSLKEAPAGGAESEDKSEKETR